MKHSKIPKSIPPGLAGSIRPEDGLDPRFDRSESELGGKDRRKAKQFCAQVRRTLELVVSEALADTEYDVVVVDVQPAPNTANLLVLLQATTPSKDPFELQEIEATLLSKAGFLRSMVAHAICRRKAPNLIFRLVPA